MERNEMITSILGLYDTIALLEAKLSFYESQKSESHTASTKKMYSQFSEVDKKIHDYAVDKILDEVLYNFRQAKAERKDDGLIYVSPFDRWLEEKSNYNDLPDWMSRDLFLSIADSKLQERYQKEKEVAIKRLLEKEKELEEKEEEGDDE